MKKIIWLVFGVMMVTAQSICAQSKIMQQKEEYERGNRDINFLKEYIITLKAEGQTELLYNVMDEYLMIIPLNERYVGDNLMDFMEFIIYVNARSFIDVIENWSELSLKEEEVNKVVEKIDNMCKMDLFNATINKEKEGIKDYGCVQMALEKSAIPLSNTRRQIIRMWQCWRNNDVGGMIRSLKKMVVPSASSQKDENSVPGLDLDTMFEGVVVGNMLNYMLEGCDQEQCCQILEILDQVIALNGHNGFMEMFSKMRDNFEGKKMMMEMGEE